MLFKKKSKVIKFTVDGRPPRKGTKSCWADEGEYVLKLRKKALEAKTKEGIDYFSGPVKLELTVFDQNIGTREDRSDYHGDLDTLVAGVLDSLQPAPTNPGFEMDSILDNNEIDPTKPLLIEDDSQIVTIVAKKIEKKENKYTVIIRPENM